MKMNYSKYLLKYHHCVKKLSDLKYNFYSTNQAIVQTVLFIFTLVQEEQNHKIGQTCFLECTTAFVSATIFMLILSTTNQAKKLVSNQQHFLFVEKTLMDISKVNMAFTAL